MLGTAAVTTVDYHRAVSGMGRLRTELARVFAEQGIDGILYPSSPIPAVSLTIAECSFAHQMEIQQTYLRNTVLAALGGMPALTQPIVLSNRHGAPVGLEVSGLPGSDRQLLSIAASIEEALARC
jgi:mandelamide amidase